MIGVRVLYGVGVWLMVFGAFITVVVGIHPRFDLVGTIALGAGLLILFRPRRRRPPPPYRELGRPVRRELHR